MLRVKVWSKCRGLGLEVIVGVVRVGGSWLWYWVRVGS